MRSLGLVLLLSVASTLPAFSQQNTTHKAKATSSSAAANTEAPSKALMDAIWAGWSSGNPANVAKYYAKGPHIFFDIAPLKYNSWAEYEKGVVQVIGGFQSLKATVNDDAQIHRHGTLVWGTATVHHVDVTKDGKKSEGDFRWTVIWEKTGPEWLIVHEHVSAPLGAQ
ncbi:MAG TPA: nuclear transport factor 2 family protein [Terriglobales bacterium]|jgi:ketosteroid isomerase-like protein|nr:nuclear transport factor 2 family protein [Terriglobales bacterium]